MLRVRTAKQSKTSATPFVMSVTLQVEHLTVGEGG
jgi:hypothetical protein